MLAAVTHQSPNLSGLIQARSFLTCVVVQWECFLLAAFHVVVWEPRVLISCGSVFL